MRSSRSYSHSPGAPPRAAQGGGGSHQGGDEGGGGGGGGGGGPMVKVAFGRNQAEAEMIQGLLLQAGVPSVLKRSIGFDVPDFLAAGPRDVYVGSDLAQEARAVLVEVTVENGEDPEWAELAEEARLRGGDGGPSPERLAIWIGAVFLGGAILAWLLYQLS